MRALTILLAGLSALPAVAQDRATVNAGGVLPAPAFGALWSTEPGLSLRVVLPAHGGTGDVAVQVLSFDSSDLTAPDFVLLTATLGWGPSLRLGPAVLTPTARLGGGLFRFDPDDDNPELSANVDESEVAFGAALRGEVAVGRVVLWAEGEALRITLRDPVMLPSLSAGVGVRFDVPPAVRRLLDE